MNEIIEELRIGLLESFADKQSDWRKKVYNSQQYASQQDVLIEFDSYFFGTQKLSEISTIDYKIVDLDNIYTATGKKSNELYDENVLAFERAICGFIRYFVNQEDQPAYLKYFES